MNIVRIGLRRYSVDMNINDIKAFLTAHKEEIEKEIKIIDYSSIDKQYYYSEITLCRINTNLGNIIWRIRTCKNEDIEIQVMVDAYSKYRDYEKLSCTRLYKTLDMDILRSWNNYIKGIKHIICVGEEHCQKIVSNGVRKGMILKGYV